MHHRDPEHRTRSWQTDDETREHIATLAAVSGRFLAAGWSSLGISLAALLLGVLIGFLALRKEAARSVRPNDDATEQAVAALRHALDAANARVIHADEAVHAARHALDLATAERAADRRELDALHAALARAEARPNCLVAPTPVVVPAQDAARDACEQELLIERDARTRTERELDAAHRGCAMLLMIGRRGPAPALPTWPAAQATHTAIDPSDDAAAPSF